MSVCLSRLALVIFCLPFTVNCFALNIGFTSPFYQSFSDTHHELTYGEIEVLLKDFRQKEITTDAVSDCEALVFILSETKYYNDQDFKFDVQLVKEEGVIHELMIECGIDINPDLSLNQNDIKIELETALDSINVDSSLKKISGHLPKGYRVSVNNLTVLSVEGRGFNTQRDTQWIDANGSFELELKSLKAGDLINLWVSDLYNKTVFARKILKFLPDEADQRGPVINFSVLELDSSLPGVVYFGSSTSRALGEPGLNIRVQSYTNDNSAASYGEVHLETKLNEYGKLSELNYSLSTNSGLEFVVLIKQEFETEWTEAGILYGTEFVWGSQKPNHDRNKVKQLSTSAKKYPVHTFEGPLFLDGVSPSDVTQGKIGDCYLAATLKTIAHYFPNRLTDENQNQIIRDNGDGSFSVYFNKYSYEKRAFDFDADKVEVVVYPDFASLSDGSAVYLRGTKIEAYKMELWAPLIEKAFAIYSSDYKPHMSEPSYDAIGVEKEVVTASFLMNALIGVDVHTQVADVNFKTVSEFDLMLEGFFSDLDFENNQHTKSILLGTRNDSMFVRRFYLESVSGSHQYAVLGYEKRDGKSFVKISNPWGRYEPVQDGIDEGDFWAPVEVMFRAVDELMIYTSK